MRPRASILGLMCVVLFIAVGVAALREANDLWASCLFTLTLVVLGLACLGAAFRRGYRRAYYAGFAASGFGYLFLCYAPWAASEVRPHLATEKLLEFGGNRRFPAPDSNSRYLTLKFVESRVAAMSPGQTADYDGDGLNDVVFTGGRGRFVPSAGSSEGFKRVGHCLFALVAALVGGIAARYFRDSS